MLEKLLKKPWFPLLPRLVCLLFFILLMLALVSGSVKILTFNFTSNLAMLIVWTVWWPFLYLTLFFLARGWCGFLCPLSLANEAGNYLRTGKGVNVIKWSFIAFPIFFLVVYTEQVSGLFLSTSMTLIFLGLFFAVAFIIGLIWRRFSFCRLICPIGTLLSAFSRLSFIGVRTDKQKCQECTTKECLKGTERAGPCPMFNNVPNLSTNKNCLICTNCIKNCPYDSAKLRFIKPGREIIQRAEFALSESFFIITLLGLTTILTTNGTRIFRKIIEFAGLSLKGPLLRGVDFILALGIFILIYFLVSLITTKINKDKLRNNLITFGYAYLPLTFFIMAFTIIFGFLAPWLSFSDSSITLTKYIFLLAGLIWSLFLLFKLGKNFQEKIPHLIFLLAIASFWFLVLIPGPLALYTPTEGVLEVQPGEVVQMDAFSMGYDPSTLIIKKDVPVVLNITNFDINHAFDIDEFDTHLVIVGGRTARVMFVPDKVGEFKFYCSIPGHEEGGMKGKLIVEEE